MPRQFVAEPQLWAVVDEAVLRRPIGGFKVMRALYLDKRDDVDHYAAAMERLCVQAEPPAHTAGILKRTLRELEAQGR